MTKRRLAKPILLLVLMLGALFVARVSLAKDMPPLRIGVILPMSGQSSSTGFYQLAGMKLYLAQHNNHFAGRGVELFVRDDTGAPDITKRLAQELVVNEHVDVLAGFGLTPLALAAAPIATAAKIPMLVSVASSAKITDASPYIVRTNLTLEQAARPMAEWCAKQGYVRAATLVMDYAPGHEAEFWFSKTFEQSGGRVVAHERVPALAPDFSASLERMKDAHPQVLFVFVGSNVSTVFMKQFDERGLREAGIQLVGTGDVVDDDVLPKIGRSTLGVITAHPYSVLNDNPQNKIFVAAFESANKGLRPSSLAVAGYDAMALMDQALQTTGGKSEGDELLAAMKGMVIDSPRGKIMIDPHRREVVQDIFIRRVVEKNGALFNEPFYTFAAYTFAGVSNSNKQEPLQSLR